MKALRLEPGKGQLGQEARELQQLNARQLNEIFTSPDMESFLQELEIKPQPTATLTQVIRSKSKETSNPLTNFLEKLLSWIKLS